jgi:hypothetical protein
MNKRRLGAYIASSWANVRVFRSRRRTFEGKTNPLKRLIFGTNGNPSNLVDVVRGRCKNWKTEQRREEVVVS